MTLKLKQPEQNLPYEEFRERIIDAESCITFGTVWGLLDDYRDTGVGMNHLGHNPAFGVERYVERQNPDIWKVPLTTAYRLWWIRKQYAESQMIKGNPMIHDGTSLQMVPVECCFSLENLKKITRKALERHEGIYEAFGKEGGDKKDSASWRPIMRLSLDLDLEDILQKRDQRGVARERGEMIVCFSPGDERDMQGLALQNPRVILTHPEQLRTDKKEQEWDMLPTTMSRIVWEIFSEEENLPHALGYNSDESLLLRRDL